MSGAPNVSEMLDVLRKIHIIFIKTYFCRAGKFINYILEAWIIFRRERGSGYLNPQFKSKMALQE